MFFFTTFFFSSSFFNFLKTNLFSYIEARIYCSSYSSKNGKMGFYTCIHTEKTYPCYLVCQSLIVVP
jgi:hypothetical protein